MPIIFKIIILILIILGIAICVYFWQRSNQQKIGGKEGLNQQSPLSESNATNMKIESPAFGNNEPLPAKYTCDGEEINPPLQIGDVPEGAKSLVLIVDDPDAPGGTWVHWTVWNIDPRTTEIAENSVPESAVEGITSFGRPGYGSPCPPSGDHRYFFKLYALDIILELAPSTTIRELEAAMQGHIIREAQVVGLYKRQR